MIVDDVQFNVEVVGRMIERQTGMQYDSAFSAMQGINMIENRQRQNNQYKHIFLDINMPEMDGVEMVKILKEKEAEKELDFSNTIIYALTAIDES